MYKCELQFASDIDPWFQNIFFMEYIACATVSNFKDYIYCKQTIFIEY